MRKYCTAEMVLDQCKYIVGRREFNNTGGMKRAAKRFGILEECLNIVDTNMQVKLTLEKTDFIKKFEQSINHCKTITEFRCKFPEFVWYLNKNLAKYKCRFISQKFSTPQLVCKKILETLLNNSCEYNCRTALGNRKELDIFFRQYKLACEYNSGFWHNSLCIQHADKVKDNMCKQLGITLLRINEPIINAYISFHEYVTDIKNQFKALISIINLITHKNITYADIENIDISHEELLANCYNYRDINFIINNCTSYAEVRHKYNKIWQYLQKNNLLHVLDPVKKRDYRHMNLNEYSKYISKECATYTLFLKHKTYPFAYRRGYARHIKQILPSSKKFRSLT